MLRPALLFVLLLTPALAAAQGFIHYWPPPIAGGGGGGTWGSITGTLADQTDLGTALAAKCSLAGCTMTGPILAADGSAAAPAYSFSGATGAGMYRAAGDLWIQSAGSGARSELNFSQFLGYGTSSYLAYDAGGLYTGVTLDSGNNQQTFWIDSVQKAVLHTSDFELRPSMALSFEGTTDNGFETMITATDPTADRNISIPNASGAVQLNLALGTAAPGSTECDAADETGRLYHQTGDPATVQSQLFRCTQTGAASWAWMPAGYQSATTAPATCSVGNAFFDTDATAGSNWFGCTSANTWTLQGGGGAGVWGSITGTLADQTDLGTALAAKCSLGGCTMTGPILGTSFGPASGTGASTGLFRLANNTKVCWRNAANGDDLCLWYDASDVFNMSGGGSGTIWTLTNATAPSTPGAGLTSVYVDSTSKNIAAKNDAGTVNHGVQSATCSAGQVVTAISDAGAVTCSSAVLFVVTANDTALTTTQAQANTLFTNTGDADGSSVTLLNDPGATGIGYSAVVTVAQTITVAPSTGETLYLNATSCANVTSNTIGAALSVVSVTSGSGAVWVASGAGWTCN